MTKAMWGIALGLGIALSLATAHAQGLEDPNAGDKKPADKKPDKQGTDEKADTSETLQKGGDVRPWAQGVPASEQKVALAAFRDGNSALNDGLFAKAAETYRSALTHWKHPAIYYNLALALMNLDNPIEAYE